jgi:hypothetical protein
MQEPSTAVNFLIWSFDRLVRLLILFFTRRSNEKIGVSDYGEIVRKAIIDRRVAEVKMKSIVGDNHSIQVRALACWTPGSFQKNRDHELSGIRFQACICHAPCFVMADAFPQSPRLKELDDSMSEMIAACNVSEVVRATRSHCPVHIVTRWFSRENSLLWLFKHEQILGTLDLSEMNAASRKKTA